VCVAGQHDGILPPMADLAFTLRITEDKIASLRADLVEKGLIDAFTLRTTGRHANIKVTFQPRGRNVTGNDSVTSRWAPQTVPLFDFGLRESGTEQTFCDFL
jgi:hypothetical protein